VRAKNLERVEHGVYRRPEPP